jgi:hypothetical protein
MPPELAEAGHGLDPVIETPTQSRSVALSKSILIDPAFQ